MSLVDKSSSVGQNILKEKIAAPAFLSGKHTDGSLPQVVWVAKGGADASGATGVSHKGDRSEPFLTASGANGAFRYTVDGRGDRVILGPGIWRENWDFGSGTGTTGSAGRMNKRDIGIYGSGGAHIGRCQVVGDGSTTGPTIRVRDGYLRGFILSDLEVGSTDSADANRGQPAIDLETNDTASLTANSSDEWALIRNVEISSGSTGTRGTAGLILSAATMVLVRDLYVSGWDIGVLFRSGANNFCDNIRFLGTTEFADNVTADIAATTYGTHAVGTWPATWTIASGHNFSNVRFMGDTIFSDVGGTPVTNYINFSGGSVVNSGVYRGIFARNVALGTLLTLATDFVVIGRDVNSEVTLVGA